MRAALLSIPDLSGDLHGGAGRAVVEWQAGVALALDCEEVILYSQHCEPSASEVLAVQKLVEDNGASFRLIRSGKALLGRLSREDRLLVLGEGVIPLGVDAQALLRGSPVLLRHSAASIDRETPLERIDSDHYWAGALLATGAMAERLSDTDDEYDPGSALVRIARSMGIAERDVPQAMVAAHEWIVARDPTAERVIADRLLRRTDASPMERALLIPLARDTAGRSFVFESSLGCGIVAGLASAAAAATFYAAVAIALAMISIVTLRFAALVRRAEDPAAFLRQRRSTLAALEIWPNVAATLSLGTGFLNETGVATASFLAVAPVLAWNLAAFADEPTPRLFRDREVLWLLVLLPGMFGFWLVGASLAGLAAIAGLAVGLGIFPSITRD